MFPPKIKSPAKTLLIVCRLCICVMLCMFICSVSVYCLSTVCCYAFFCHYFSHYISHHLRSVCVCEDSTNNPFNLAKLEFSVHATQGLGETSTTAHNTGVSDAKCEGGKTIQRLRINTFCTQVVNIANHWLCSLLECRVFIRRPFGWFYHPLV